jgi:hypothetical protein
MGAKNSTAVAPAPFGDGAGVVDPTPEWADLSEDTTEIAADDEEYESLTKSTI